jgi:hypothetical protein
MPVVDQRTPDDIDQVSNRAERLRDLLDCPHQRALVGDVCDGDCAAPAEGLDALPRVVGVFLYVRDDADIGAGACHCLGHRGPDAATATADDQRNASLEIDCGGHGKVLLSGQKTLFSPDSHRQFRPDFTLARQAGPHMTMTDLPANSRPGSAGRSQGPSRGDRALSAPALSRRVGPDLVIVFVANIAIVLAMWLAHGGWAEITAGRSGFFVGLAQLTGLYASLLALAGITIAARPAMLERRVGSRPCARLAPPAGRLVHHPRGGARDRERRRVRGRRPDRRRARARRVAHALPVHGARDDRHGDARRDRGQLDESHASSAVVRDVVLHSI